MFQQSRLFKDAKILKKFRISQLNVASFKFDFLSKVIVPSFGPIFVCLALAKIITRVIAMKS